MREIPIKPWYREYTGSIEIVKENTYMACDKYEISKNGSLITVNELPIGFWTEDFKKLCESLVDSKKIKSFKNFSKPSIVKFEISVNSDFDIEDLKLKKFIHTSNMVLFDCDNKIKKYEDVYSIVSDFCITRLDYYVKRKAYQVSKIESQLQVLSNKYRFV